MVKVEDNDVLVLVDSAERPEEIDVARRRGPRKRSCPRPGCVPERCPSHLTRFHLFGLQAQEALLQQRSRQEHQIAQATLARALNRLRVKNMGIGR